MARMCFTHEGLSHPCVAIRELQRRTGCLPPGITQGRFNMGILSISQKMGISISPLTNADKLIYNAYIRVDFGS